MEFNARQIADLLNGFVEGNPDVCVSKLSKIEEAVAGTMTFLANPLYTNFIYTTRASIIVVSEDFLPAQMVSGTLIRVPNAYTAFATLLEVFSKNKNEKKGISPLACIAKTARLGSDVYIGEFTSIGENVVIGNNVKIFPNTSIGDHSLIGDETIVHSHVSVYEETVIGKNCTIHSGVVIGSDGF